MGAGQRHVMCVSNTTNRLHACTVLAWCRRGTHWHMHPTPGPCHRCHTQRVGGSQLDAGHALVLQARRTVLLQQPRVLAADCAGGKGKLS